MTNTNNENVKMTVRIAQEQRKRLEKERVVTSASGLSVCLRSNLALAFALKDEFAAIVDEEVDFDNPECAPKIIHSLLFRTEQRLLGAMDNLLHLIDGKLSSKADTAEGSKEKVEFLDALDVVLEHFPKAENVDRNVLLGLILHGLKQIDGANKKQLDSLATMTRNWLAAEGVSSRAKRIGM